MSSLEANTFDLAICDPPYGLNEGKKPFNRNTPITDMRNGKSRPRPAKVYNSGEWDQGIPDKKYFDLLSHVSKKILLFGGQHYTHLIPQSKGWIVWDKVNGNTHFGDCELIWSSWLGKTYLVEYMWNGMNQGVSLKTPRITQGNKKLNEKRIHPSQKPIRIYKYLLKNFAEKGWKIFDSHLGSGSSRIAAHELGFEFVGCELDNQFFKSQESRWEKHTVQYNLFNTQNYEEN